MSAAGVQRDPRPSVVSMGALLAAGAAATAVSTPPVREHAPDAPEGTGAEVGARPDVREQAAPESEAA
ncbi:MULTISPECIES: hypothetical protein [unclassified Streptomyces]|uniref:hypothetical protein n=1 Tax=unclassified Streptomyces TaxID=2593676 RepID=UPI0022507ECB|nr:MULTISPECIES: hypothetical protein [unclassified Streptomyces]MCX5145976.1 hypothetical protein [Streptomyces sp. NBC_00320]WSN49211.1 hypothetical protein OG299_16715 [Streptomyces sp. NBC_01296]WSW61386.1 hypothetical protein OG513_23935 [Streptomyces sp. NBC_00998]